MVNKIKCRPRTDAARIAELERLTRRLEMVDAQIRKVLAEQERKKAE